MTSIVTQRDPVQGLVDYVQDIKPYHTKIMEIWVEYIHQDKINAKIVDELDMEIHIDIDRRYPCKYGWDTSPWGNFWHIKDVSEITTGEITYVDGSTTKTIDRFQAYQLFFQFLSDRWQWRVGEKEEPHINKDPENRFYPLSFDNVLKECTDYWTNLTQQNQFWIDPRINRLYKRNGNEWVEQPFYYTANEPKEAVEGDYWYSTYVNKLYARVSNGWAEIRKVYFSYDVPVTSPTHPEEWRSNWDYPVCHPRGDTVIYARVTDLLSFEHGGEIFLFDHARIAVADPIGRDRTDEAHVPGKAYPIKFRTNITQTSRYRYKLEREEISVITEPDNQDIRANAYTVNLDAYDFEGWDIELVRKDVKLGSFLTWKWQGETVGTKLISDNLINRQTFHIRAEAGSLVIQRVEENGTLTDADCPWVNGTIVYLRSTGDLPEFTLNGKKQRLKRYQPYRIVRQVGDNRHFSLSILNKETLAVDTAVMGSLTKLSFTDEGSGQRYIGIGYPVPFMEVRTNYKDSIKGKFKDRLSSSVEAFLGHELLEILDVIAGYTGNDGAPHNGFVIGGSYAKVLANSEITVVNSNNEVNNGEWKINHTQQWTNKWAGVAANGTLIPSQPPAWWNASHVGAWPLPTKRPQKEIDQLVALGQYEDEMSEYDYAIFTTLGVQGPAPTLTPRVHGYITLDHYKFDDGSTIKTAATVVDKLIFGSLRAIQNPDGTTRFEREIGVPGVSIVLKDKIATTIQEGLVYDDPYGGPTIGTYDITYFDQDTYDENLATIITRLHDQ